MKNVKRANISSDDLLQLAKDAADVQAYSRSEIILGMPGETLQTHFDTNETIVNAGFDKIDNYQLMMIPGTEVTTPENIEQFGMQTRYRILPRCSGYYKILGETICAAEIDKICTSTDSLPFDAYFRKFYDEFFFPTLAEREIKTVLHLGDIFDRRKYMNYNTLKSCKEYFFDQAKDLNIDMHVVPGNHDTYFKNTNSVNAPELLLQEYENVKVYPEITELEFDNRKILFVPWICSDNYSSTMEMVGRTDAKVCFGHFEFSGFQMYAGMPNEHGMDHTAFEHFDLVCSGHYHHRSSRDNVVYLGNPYEITWSDFNDARGFNIYDTETNELEFMQNPYRMFHKISVSYTHLTLPTNREV